MSMDNEGRKCSAGPDELRKFRTACSNGWMNQIEFMLGQFEADTLRTGDSNPLRVAAHQGHVDVCERLLKAGFPVDGYDKGQTPLMSAALMNMPQICTLLLEAGADMSLRSIDRGTAAEGDMTALDIAFENRRTGAESVLRSWQARLVALDAASEVHGTAPAPR